MKKDPNSGLLVEAMIFACRTVGKRCWNESKFDHAKSNAMSWLEAMERAIASAKESRYDDTLREINLAIKIELEVPEFEPIATCLIKHIPTE